MKKYLIGLLAGLFILTPTAGGSFAHEDEPFKEKIDALASTVIADYDVSSLQYAIMDQGEIQLSDHAGVNDQATGESVTKDTMYGIGSVSKMYVSAATMMLVDKNLVDLDEPLTSYIKDFQMADERYQQITPRMLLNHSSGLYGSHYENIMLFDDNDTQSHDELLQKLRTEHLKSDPGEYSVYCNDGFTLLEILVERVSGMTYNEFVDQYISTPLDLHSTKTPLDTFDRERLAKTYFPGIDKALPAENANVLGAGGIYSTAEEVAKFAELLMGNRPDLLSERSADVMKNDEYRNGIWVEEETNIFNYGLGWDSVSLSPFSDYGITALSKGGDTVMYHAALIAVPEYNISIVALSSGGSSLYNNAFATAALLQYMIEKEIVDELQPDQAFDIPEKAEQPSEEIQAYSGVYGLVGETIEVNIQQGEVEMPAQLGGVIPAQTYMYAGDGRFTSSDGSASISFVEESNGHTYLKLDAYLNFPGLSQMRMVSYEYQKLDVNPLNEAVEEKWQARDGKTYYALEEKINSLFYLSSSLLNKTVSLDLQQGYANATKIVDANHSVNAVEIPNMNGRDAFDFHFHEGNDAEYLTVNGQSFISEDSINPIYGGQSSITTILSDGHARWYTIDEESADKKMIVDIQGNGGYLVYDADGTLLYSSLISDEAAVELSTGGKVVFGGNAGDVFHIRMSE
ncbi:serine hydrolase [Alkalihalobacillus oceani]|uniref:serine hydrolase n=1 Tax=Halalkalibacter oceani TaxID=1653776 RepID=UPI00203AAD66|nr:serine hydrolase [Halalkalibacter oceani]MCM3762708.1 serine hydrolase [Halalkalibacter oceani]